jgi:hypothetical protein
LQLVVDRALDGSTAAFDAKDAFQSWNAGHCRGARQVVWRTLKTAAA